LPPNWTINNDSKALDSLLDRLDKRVIEGFSDYIAIKAETPLLEEEIPDVNHSAITLYAQNGKAVLWCRYLVGDQYLENGRKRNAPVVSLFNNWPKPDIQEILEKLKDAQPSEYSVTDGERRWPHNKSPIRTLSQIIWRGRRNLLLDTKEARVELLKDSDRPNLTGIYAPGKMYRCNDGSMQKIEQIFWVDTEPDDMPVESISRDYEADGTTVKSLIHMNYFEHGKLPSGKWYPVRWTQSYTIVKRQVKDVREFHLQIYPDYKLDKTWFQDPIIRLLEKQ
jgi:hypothetical protein